MPNLLSVKNYNDKLQWLKLFDQEPLKVICSDKLLVRCYVKSKSFDNILPKVLDFAQRPSEINWNLLPEKFVVKTNHDSGTVILVKTKCSLDIASIVSRLNASLNRTYGVQTGEWNYQFISPCVLVEEFLESFDHEPISDYKFHCVHGCVKFVQYIYERDGRRNELIAMPNGDVTCLHLSHELAHGRSADFLLPCDWDAMIQIASILSAPFKYVRVDLYFVNGRIYFGEMTFFPMWGCYKSPHLEYFGSCLDFDMSDTRDPLEDDNEVRALEKLLPKKV
jgi:hypothetical protein